MADCRPILLRPPEWLAEAMTRAADDAGESRQVWMLQTLAFRVLDGGYARRPDDHELDDPLPGT